MTDASFVISGMARRQAEIACRSVVRHPVAKPGQAVLEASSFYLLCLWEWRTPASVFEMLGGLQGFGATFNAGD